MSDTQRVAIGDRIAVIRRSGELLAGTLVYRSADALTLDRGGSKTRPVTLPLGEVERYGRILWASQ